jgi:hypothetical protein
MCAFPKTVAMACVFLAGCSAPLYGQGSLEDLRAGIDDLAAAAYRSALEAFPCKLKTRGKAKMLRWQDVDKCLNNAHNKVDWESLSRRLQDIRKKGRYEKFEIVDAVESAMADRAISYDKIFLVKEEKALLPLSNSVLKFLPVDSLLDLPVYDKSGEHVGTFSGVYQYERAGGLLAANEFQISVFQYMDFKGNMQVPTPKLLLDSYGVPWKKAASQPGFRLPVDDIIPKH